MDDQEEVVGSATGLVAPNDTVEVVAMYVTPEARGQGCAGQLLDAVTTAARERGRPADAAGDGGQRAGDPVLHPVRVQADGPVLADGAQP